MVTTETEFTFLRLCFDNPELWVIQFKPIDPLALWVKKQVDNYALKFYKYPSLVTFLNILKTLNPPQQTEYIAKALTATLDKEYVIDSVVSYVEEQRLTEAIMKAKVLLGEHKVQEARSVLLNGTDVVFNMAFDYFTDKRKDTKYTYVSTGFSRFDRPLGGGLHKQNLGLLIGPKSSGKSATMINFVVNAVESGESALHISFEDSLDQIITRYDKRFSHSKRKIQDKKLRIHVFPSGGATVADCESLVNLYHPGLVVVDYLNEMGWENKKAGRSEDFGDRARGLRGVSFRHNCAIWTAQQAGKESKYTEKDVSAEDGFWSYEPAQVADAVVTINQTKEEREQSKIRYILDRNRNGADGLSFDFKINYGEMFIEDSRRF